MANSNRFNQRSLGLKILLVGALVFLLGLPLLFVNILAWERADRAGRVASEIGEAYGGPQAVRGPFLVIPVRVIDQVTVTSREGETREETNIRNEMIVVSADELNISAQLETDTRRRAIYDVPVYRADLTFSGQFAPGDLTDLIPENGNILWDESYIIVAFNDLRSIDTDLEFSNLDQDGTLLFEPGTDFDRDSKTDQSYRRGNASYTNNWVGVAADLPGFSQGNIFKFKARMSISGAQYLAVTASGRETQISISGDWPHPGFDGFLLPDERSISDDGFEASWIIPYLARGVPSSWRENAGTSMRDVDATAIAINLVSPTDGYVRVSRALKYALFFLAFTLLMIFLIEANGKTRIHAAQYTLIGMAQVIFYLLLLALSEHWLLQPAYLAAAGATTAVTGLYAASAFSSFGKGLIIGLALCLSFALQYMLLLLEDYALLIGAGMAFISLAVTMFMTRSVGWYSVTENEPQKIHDHAKT